jgi:hypothetical protein
VKTRDRFWAVMNRTKADRLPMTEWAMWWRDATIARWFSEGLPNNLPDDIAIRAHFGLDDWRQSWIGAVADDAPPPASHGAPLISNRSDYEAFTKFLWPDPKPQLDQLRTWKAAQKKRDCVVWITLEGYFWFPRRLFGIEPHLFAFYDQPELMKEINARLTEHNIALVKAVADVLQPDFFTFAEDLSYNHGPMLSRELFDEFVTPYYRELLPHIKKLGSVTIMDSDGQVEPIGPWLESCGLDGVLPLERQAGVDVAKLRRNHPKLVMVGAFDKMTMPLGREAMRAEFERLLPVMRTGRFFPSCDHQTPPGVSLENYHIYLELFKEYAARAVEGW